MSKNQKYEKRLKIGDDGVILDGKKVDGVIDYKIQAHVDQEDGNVECRLDLTIILEQSELELEL